MSRLGTVLAPLRTVYSACGRAYNAVRPRCWLVRWLVGEGDVTGRLILVNIRAHSAFFGQVFASGYKERYIGRVWLWALPAILARRGEGYSGVYARIPRPYHRLLPPGTWFAIPNWLDTEVNLPLSRRVMASSNVKKDLRRIEKNGYTYTITRDLDVFKYFYQNMHKPYVSRAHGKATVLTPWGKAKELLLDSELLLVKAQHESISGGLILFGGGIPRLTMVGVRDGSREYVRNGALSARYHFSLRYLVEKGYQKASLGLLTSFLRDGGLRYKKKLGIRLVGAHGACVYFQPGKNGVSVRKMLRANPFCFMNNDLLYGCVFIDPDLDQTSGDAMAHLHQEFFVDGMTRLYVVVPEGFSGGIRLQPHEAQAMTVVAAPDLPLIAHASDRL